MKYFLCLLCFISLTTNCAKKAGAGAFRGKAYTAQEQGTRTFYPTLQEAGPCTLIEEGRLVLIGAAGGTRMPHECKDQEWIPVTTSTGVITREIGAQGDKGEAGKDGTPDTETAENRRLSEVALAGSEQAKRDAETAAGGATGHAGNAQTHATAAAGHAATVAANLAATTAASAAAATALTATQLLATAPGKIEKTMVVPAGGRISFDLATAAPGSNEEKFRMATEHSRGAHVIANEEGAVYDPRYEGAPLTQTHFISDADFPTFFLQNQKLVSDTRGSVQVLRKEDHYFLLYRNRNDELIFATTNIWGGALTTDKILDHADKLFRLTTSNARVYAVGIDLDPGREKFGFSYLDTTNLALAPVSGSLPLSAISNANTTVNPPKLLDIAAFYSGTLRTYHILALANLGDGARLIQLTNNTDRGGANVRPNIPFEKYTGFYKEGGFLGVGQTEAPLSENSACLGAPHLNAAGTQLNLSAYAITDVRGNQKLQEIPITFNIAGGTTAGGAPARQDIGGNLGGVDIKRILTLHCSKDNGSMVLSVNKRIVSHLIETEHAGTHLIAPKWKTTIRIDPPKFENDEPLSVGAAMFRPSIPGSTFPTREGYVFFQPERHDLYFQSRINWLNPTLSEKNFLNIEHSNPNTYDGKSHVKIVSMPQGDATKEYPFVNMIWTHSDGSIYLRRIQLDDQLAAPHMALLVNQVPGSWNWQMLNPYPFPLRMKITLTR